MRIVKYLCPVREGPPRWYYGTPVEIRTGQPGHWRTIEAVYQFHTLDQAPAVVHWPTGMLINWD